MLPAASSSFNRDNKQGTDNANGLTATHSRGLELIFLPLNNYFYEAPSLLHLAVFRLFAKKIRLYNEYIDRSGIRAVRLSQSADIFAVNELFTAFIFVSVRQPKTTRKAHKLWD